MRIRALPLLALACLLVAAAEPPAGDDKAALIPEAIRAMLDAAIESGNDADVATIVKYARAADPISGDAVLAVAEKWRHDREEARETTIREAKLFDLWKGSVQLGGYLTTGNSQTGGATATLDALREGLRWRHKFHGQADYQSANRVTTREHYVASYEPNYKIDERAYVYGTLQYESDRFLGFDDRYSTSVGLGYSVVKSPRVQLDLELGPAFRATSYTDGRDEESAAARGSLDLKWKLLNGLSLSQVAAAYVQRYNSTLSGTTAITAKLIGPLSASLSYQIQYEDTPPAGSVSTDTTSRASLVYSF